MRKSFLVLTLIVVTALNVWAKNYETGGTGLIGGITLFDIEGPLVGLNNPALLTSGYHQIPFNPARILSDPGSASSGFGDDETRDDLIDNVYDPRGLLPKYGFGRLYLANAYVGIGTTEGLLEGSPYIMNLLRGSEPNMPQNLGELVGATLPTVINFDLTAMIKFLTLGMLDITPLYDTNRISELEMVTNVLSAVQAGKIGLTAMFNVNLLSYYHQKFGFSIYVSGETTAGLFGTSRSLLVANDPAAKVGLEAGLALSLGAREVQIPFIGKSSVGYTVRLFSAIEGETESFDEALLMYSQLTNYYGRIQQELPSNPLAFMNFSEFGNGQYIRGGIGLALDLGFVRKINEVTTLAGKINDIISPRFWFNNNSLGWHLPDLSLGFRFTAPIKGGWKFVINKPSLFIQLDDLLYTENKAFLAKLHLGASTKFLFDIFTFGVGLNAGYPTLGFSIEITPMIIAQIPGLKYLFYVLAPFTYAHVKYHFTVYGQELGRYPGEFGFQGYNTGVEFYWGF